MSFTIELTPEAEAMLQMEADSLGLSRDELVTRLVTRHLPIDARTPSATSANGATNVVDPDLVARVRSIRGKYAHTANESGTEQLRRERQRDKARLDSIASGHKP